jgi:hypothetical protein
MVMVAVKEKEKTPVPEVNQLSTIDLVAYCPGCKAMQTIQISDKHLAPTRKFIQVGPYIYHDCGSQKPCRLYQNL